MSSRSFANQRNSDFYGNIVLKNANSYIKFSDGSTLSSAGGGGGGNVSTNTINTYTNTSTNNFENAEITCATQLVGNNSTFVATTEFVQTALLNTGNVSTTGNNVYTNTSTNNFQDAEITCSTQDSTDNSYLVANTAFVQTRVGTAGQLSNNCAGIGIDVLQNTLGSYNTAIGSQSGINDVGVSSNNNTYLGTSASQQDTDTHSYQFLTLIGSNSEPVIQGLNSQIVLGSTTGNETVFIPNTSLQFGVGNASILYDIIGSGNDSSVRLLCNDTTGTTQSTIVANYAESIFYSETNLFVQGLVSANLGLLKEVSDDPYSSQNATIYWNGNNSLPQTQQLRVNLGGTLYYINLTPV